MGGWTTLEILQFGCLMLFGAAGIAAAWFEFRNYWQTPDERQLTQAAYGQRWQTIQSSGIGELPERAIEWFLEQKSKISRLLERPFSLLDTPKAGGQIALTLLPAALGLGPLWLRHGPWIALLTFVLYISGGLGVILVETRKLHLAAHIFWAILVLGFGAGAVVFAYGYVVFLLGLNLVLGVLGMAILAPLLSVVLALAIQTGLAAATLGSADLDYGKLVAVAAAASFVVTMTALLIGTSLEPAAPTPKTLQMLVVNVVCDGLTMSATFWVLGAAVRPAARISIPTAIVSDLGIASLLAVLSLYLGLLGSDLSLTLRETLNVLVARAPSGSNVALGPYFWAMHTTFLPTILYLLLIMFCYFARMVVLPVTAVLGRGAIKEKPHQLTAFSFAFIAALFGAIAALIEPFTT